MYIKDSNVYPLPGTGLQYFHLATVEDGKRLFWCFVHVNSSKVFIEETTTGFLVAIDDDNLFNDLGGLLQSQKIMDARLIHQKVTAWKIKNYGAIEHDV